MILEDGSWLLLRPSGTEPVVRVYAEASTERQLDALVKEGEALIGFQCKTDKFKPVNNMHEEEMSGCRSPGVHFSFPIRGGA